MQHVDIRKDALSNNVKTINGNTFSFHVEKNELSVISGSYIIAPDGTTIKIFNNEDHSTVFSNYINKYLENDNNEVYHYVKCIDLLTNHYNHVLYWGVKEEDIKDIYARQSTNGYAFFILPDDLSKLSNIQIEKINELINSNHSILFKKDIIELKYQTTNMLEAAPISELIQAINANNANQKKMK